MKLRDLEPKLLRITDERTYYHGDDVTVAAADGVEFLCPRCFETNGGPVGTHAIICWRPNVPQTFYPVPGRWELVGTNYDDLTLEGEKSSSVLLDGPGCGAHFFVRNGEVTFT